MRMVWCGWIESATPSARARSCCVPARQQRPAQVGAAGAGQAQAARRVMGTACRRWCWLPCTPRRRTCQYKPPRPGVPPPPAAPRAGHARGPRDPHPPPPARTMDSNSVERMTKKGNMKTRVVNQDSMKTAPGRGARVGRARWRCRGNGRLGRTGPAAPPRSRPGCAAQRQHAAPSAAKRSTPPCRRPLHAPTKMAVVAASCLAYRAICARGGGRQRPACSNDAGVCLAPCWRAHTAAPQPRLACPQPWWARSRHLPPPTSPQPPAPPTHPPWRPPGRCRWFRGTPAPSRPPASGCAVGEMRVEAARRRRGVGAGPRVQGAPPLAATLHRRRCRPRAVRPSSVHHDEQPTAVSWTYGGLT